MEKPPANPGSSFWQNTEFEELHGNGTYLQFHFTGFSLKLRDSESFIWSHIAGRMFQASKCTGQCSSLGSHLKTKFNVFLIGVLYLD